MGPWGWLILLMGCDADEATVDAAFSAAPDDEAADDEHPAWLPAQLPPPDAPTTAPTLVVPFLFQVGEPGDVLVTDLPAGAAVDLFGSTTGTADAAGPCPPPYAGVCLDLESGRFVRRVTADAEGTATFTVTIPASAPDRVWMQAAHAHGSGALVSAVRSAAVGRPEVCDDGLDNDLDGYTDCDDPDCWGNGCAGRRASLTGVDAVTHTIDERFEQGCGASYTHEITDHLELLGPRGELAVYEAGSAVPTAICAWSAERVLATYSVGEYGPQGQVLREGFTVEPGCGWTTDGFLPDVLFVDPDGDPGTVTFRDLLDRRQPWLVGAAGAPSTAHTSWTEDCDGWLAPGHRDITTRSILDPEVGVPLTAGTPHH